MSNTTRNKTRKDDIYEKYRRILKRPNLTKKEIDEMRKNLGLLAQTICEYVWKKKFYCGMGNGKKAEIRELKNGDWYWIQRGVIQKTPKIRATGIAVYNLLASLADRNQSCFPSQKYIANSLGYSRSTINRTLRLLEKNGLIRMERRNRYHCVYELLKVRCKASETQMSNRRNSDVKQINTNNNKLTRINNNIFTGNKDFLDTNPSAFKRFKPRNREELLALDLTEALNDHQNLPLYLFYSRKYPESFLRKVLGEVKEIPFRQIKKGRGALFNHLIKRYAQETHKNSRD